MNIRAAKHQDITQIATLHLDRFASFFLSSLGKGFLEVYYRSFLTHPGLLLVLEEEGSIKGFASGSYINQSLYKTLILKNFWSYTKAGMVLVLTKPKALFRIMSNLKSAGGEQMTYSELLSIATVKNKKGYGAALLEAFENHIKAEDKAEEVTISLTTDVDDNEKAVAFYRANGYEVAHVFEGYQNRKMYRFLKKIKK